MTYTVTHQTTHALPPAGTQNALDESHKKASAQQAAPRRGELARCRRAHCARFGRWRSQKHRWWPSAGVSGGDRSLTCRSRSLTLKWSFALSSQPWRRISGVCPTRSLHGWLRRSGASRRSRSGATLRGCPPGLSLALRHRSSTPVRRAACRAGGFVWLLSRAFCGPPGERICVV